MPYTKTNWVTGDVVTAEKMNKIETRIDKGMIMVVNVFQNDDTLNTELDATWQEIYNALTSGVVVIAMEHVEIEHDVNGNIVTEHRVYQYLISEVSINYFVEDTEPILEYAVYAHSSNYGIFTANSPNERLIAGDDK